MKNSPDPLKVEWAHIFRREYKGDILRKKKKKGSQKLSGICAKWTD